MGRKRILLIIIGFFFQMGCSDYLDQDPEQMNTLEKVFSSRQETLNWHARLFSTEYLRDMLTDASWFQPYFNATDDAANMMDSHIRTLVLGTINPAQPVTGWVYIFGLYYQAIRHANIFIENVEINMELGESEKARLIAEARFMRAYYHYMLLRSYGPIPIMTTSQYDEDDNLLPARNSMDECVHWLVTELDDVANNGLPEEQIAANMGFPTKGAAMGLKARILLMNASPMYNGNSAYASWRNPDGKQLISQTYDIDKWKIAADAAKAVINYGKYSLFREAYGDPAIEFDAYVENYRKATTIWNSEIIWGRSSNPAWWVSGNLPAVFLGWNGRNSVSLELANDYFMADGSKARPIDEWFITKRFSDAPGNGTVEDTFWMFVDREPRFYASLHFPNMEVSYAPASHPGLTYRLEFFRTGNSGLDVSTGDRTFTGFTPRKHVALSTTSYKGPDGTSPVYSPRVPYPIIRYAEILLNYCEAMNEYAGGSSHPEILSYLNQIRTRAGLPEYTGSYSQSEMREMLRHERRIELTWEEHRFFDVRRWFIAHGPNGVFNKPVHGFDLTRGTHAKDPAFFTKTKIQDRTFRIEHYMLPIRASETAYNTNLVQAPYY